MGSLIRQIRLSERVLSSWTSSAVGFLTSQKTSFLPAAVPQIEHEIAHESDIAMFDVHGSSQTANVLRHIIAEDDGTHGRLACARTAHEQHLALLLSLQALHDEQSDQSAGQLGRRCYDRHTRTICHRWGCFTQRWLIRWDATSGPQCRQIEELLRSFSDNMATISRDALKAVAPAWLYCVFRSSVIIMTNLLRLRLPCFADKLSSNTKKQHLRILTLQTGLMS
jgi:hypothetical protein